jgi:hypothetical protein
MGSLGVPSLRLSRLSRLSWTSFIISKDSD